MCALIAHRAELFITPPTTVWGKALLALVDRGWVRIDQRVRVSLLLVGKPHLQSGLVVIGLEGYEACDQVAVELRDGVVVACQCSWLVDKRAV